jgi:hypothetical protein
VKRQSFEDIGRAPRALLDARSRRGAAAVGPAGAVAVAELDVIATAPADLPEVESADLTMF